jgi:hypothetical protein
MPTKEKNLYAHGQFFFAVPIFIFFCLWRFAHFLGLVEEAD